MTDFNSQFNFKKNDQSYQNITSSDLNKSHNVAKKTKKFFRIIIPIILIEAVLVGALLTYLILLPKNHCKISVDHEDAIIYVNDKKNKKFRMNIPEESKHCMYVVDVDIELPKGKNYLVIFTLTSDEFEVEALTEAEKVGDSYSLEVEGGTKNTLISGFNLHSNKEVKKFEIKFDINISNVWL